MNPGLGDCKQQLYETAIQVYFIKISKFAG